MLQMRPNCELCDRGLPANKEGALICSLECTFCEACTPGACPNCGGVLTQRPTRAVKWHAKYPPSTQRVLKST